MDVLQEVNTIEISPSMAPVPCEPWTALGRWYSVYCLTTVIEFMLHDI
jgi:hypothetical protein